MTRGAKIVKDTYSEIQMPFLCPDGSLGTILLQERDSSLPDDPLYQRAWTMQEYVLVPRTLIYSKYQMFWKCRTSFERDGGDISWVTFTLFGRFKLTQLGLGELHAFTGADPHTTLGASI